MAHEAPPNSPQRPWSMTELRTPSKDIGRNAALGFVRLAQLEEMSPALTQAYDARLHPDAHLLLGDLTEQLRVLEPADLGRFVALEYANSVQHIYTKAASDEEGLTLTVPDTPLFQKGPEHGWCDLEGNQHRIFRAPSQEYGRAMHYRDDLDVTIDQIFQAQHADSAVAQEEYQHGWESAGYELVSGHLTYLEQVRQHGPILELDRSNEQDVRMLALLDKLCTRPESQSDGKMA